MPDRPAKPADLPRLIPYLTVKDPAKTLAFYQKAFGFEPREQNILKGPDGKIMHAEVRIKEAVVMFGPEDNPGCKAKSPNTSGTPAPVGLYVYCEDVDALWKRATAAGAKPGVEPVDMFWGDRMCQLFDIDGHSWTFAKNVADFDPSKMPKR